MRLASKILFALASLPAAAQVNADLPDVIGLRPGMSAQEAYNALKAHSNGARVGVGQSMIAGYDKPVVTLMSEEVLGASPREIITVWLTLPPSRQVVWAISRSLTFEQGKEPLTTVVLDGLRKKYGPETDPQFHGWAFDDQGAPAPNAGPRGSNCMHVDQLNLTSPDAPSNPVGSTPLINTPGPPTACSGNITIRSEIHHPTTLGNELASAVIVFLQDTPIARQSQEAYQAYLRNAGNLQHQQELNRARQQQRPTF